MKKKEMDRFRDELRAASVFAAFVCEAQNRGYSAKITVEVDGIPCETGLLLSAKDPLMEYLANWACGQKYIKEIELMQFQRECKEDKDIQKEAKGFWEWVSMERNEAKGGEGGERGG